MRMRKRHNLEPRLERCASVIIGSDECHKGQWHNDFGSYDTVYLELGCGKGKFTAGTAEADKGSLIIGLEKVPDAMVIATERVCAADLDNVRFICDDVQNLKEMFALGDIDRIYINFCDPWPKSRDAKLRLTAPSFLRLYSDILPVGGEIHFKTDNLPLFNWSENQFISEGWELSEVTRDLHGNGINGIMTDYEEKFHNMGTKINRLVARKTAATKDGTAGTPGRLRNASLCDAVGYEESRAANEAGAEAE